MAKHVIDFDRLAAAYLDLDEAGRPCKWGPGGYPGMPGPEAVAQLLRGCYDLGQMAEEGVYPRTTVIVEKRDFHFETSLQLVPRPGTEDDGWVKHASKLAPAVRMPGGAFVVRWNPADGRWELVGIADIRCEDLGYTGLQRSRDWPHVTLEGPGRLRLGGRGAGLVFAQGEIGRLEEDWLFGPMHRLVAMPFLRAHGLFDDVQALGPTGETNCVSQVASALQRLLEGVIAHLRRRGAGGTVAIVPEHPTPDTADAVHLHSHAAKPSDVGVGGHWVSSDWSGPAVSIVRRIVRSHVDLASGARRGLGEEQYYEDLESASAWHLLNVPLADDWAERVACAATVDGALILNAALTMVACGAKLPIRTRGGQGTREVRRGTRYQSAWTLASAHPGAVVVVVSQDGGATALCAKDDGSVASSSEVSPFLGRD